MNKIIEINNWELADVAGGCWCNCISKLFDFSKPTTSIGVVADENDCRSRCITKQLIYGRCFPNPPERWESPLGFVERIKKEKQI